MSIRDEIKARRDEGWLYRLSLDPGSEEKRTLYVSKGIHALLVGPWQDQPLQDRWLQIRADLDAFVDGSRITLPRDRQRSPKNPTHMAQLRPANDEVWEYRHRRPEPSIRLFGRFAEKDSFIALTWEYRADLGAFRSREWRNAKLRWITEWRWLFYWAYEPLRGRYPDDYISNYYLL
jgi:hypothetical protein